MVGADSGLGYNSLRMVPSACGGVIVARILVVDDDANLRSLLRTLLEDAGFTVIEATNGGAAIQAYRRQPADVVLCDLFMPDRDGLEVIRDLREAFPEVKIISMSGGGFGNSVDMLPVAKHFGAAEILYKPFEQEDVLAAIHRVLGSRETT
jgi:CheY-like chemotaxis protein